MGICKIETWQLECDVCHHIEMVGRKVQDTDPILPFKMVFNTQWPTGFIRHVVNLRDSDWSSIDDRFLCSKCYQVLTDVHSERRWNWQGDLVCKGEHDRSDGCDFKPATALEIAVRQKLRKET